MDTDWLLDHRGVTLGAFGGVAGFFALFFFSDIPRVRKDIVTVCWHFGMIAWAGANISGRKSRSLGSISWKRFLLPITYVYISFVDKLVILGHSEWAVTGLVGGRFKNPNEHIN
jgi:hypothetical protein